MECLWFHFSPQCGCISDGKGLIHQVEISGRLALWLGMGLAGTAIGFLETVAGNVCKPLHKYQCGSLHRLANAATFAIRLVQVLDDETMSAPLLTRSHHTVFLAHMLFGLQRTVSATSCCCACRCRAQISSGMWRRTI
jgi:hypothetical protein